MTVSFQAGRTVPLKFQVFSGATELTDPSLITMSATQVSCDGSLPTLPLDLTTSGGTSLRYDPVAGQFIDNWQTPATPGACYSVTATTADGSSVTALFQLG